MDPLTPEDIAGILADPRWLDPNRRNAIAGRMPPEMLAQVLEAEKGQETPSSSPWEAAGQEALKFGGALGGAALAGAATGGLGAIPALLAAMAGGGAGSYLAGQMAGSENPLEDTAWGAAGPVTGPAMKVTGSLLRRAGPLARFVPGAQWATRVGGAALEKAGGLIDDVWPHNLMRGAGKAGVGDAITPTASHIGTDLTKMGHLTDDEVIAALRGGQPGPAVRKPQLRQVRSASSAPPKPSGPNYREPPGYKPKVLVDEMELQKFLDSLAKNPSPGYNNTWAQRQGAIKRFKAGKK